MTKITGETCIPLLQKTFPNFLSYWQTYIDSWGDDLGLTIHMMPFADYIVDVIKTGTEADLEKIFQCIEFLLNNGDSYVQDAVATGLLEDLLSRSPDEINFRNFVHHLGTHTIEYCKAWDEFTGVKTEGLWD